MHVIHIMHAILCNAHHCILVVVRILGQKWRDTVIHMLWYNIDVVIYAILHTYDIHTMDDKSYPNNSYIPQMEQHEPEGWMLFCLGKVTYLLDVTPSTTQCHTNFNFPALFYSSSNFGC